MTDERTVAIAKKMLLDDSSCMLCRYCVVSPGQLAYCGLTQNQMNNMDICEYFKGPNFDV